MARLLLIVLFLFACQGTPNYAPIEPGPRLQAPGELVETATITTVVVSASAPIPGTQGTCAGEVGGYEQPGGWKWGITTYSECNDDCSFVVDMVDAKCQQDYGATCLARGGCGAQTCRANGTTMAGNRTEVSIFRQANDPTCPNHRFRCTLTMLIAPGGNVKCGCRCR